ncbi:hypothetical protein [Gordonia sp. SID5947]|uniref:hypothetical protein n=1 Tax=Gordonia sp. SID5947 TaxID=2690315 RepID=UPI001928B601|nr:hypothetical protein [Gordonia sp. SID5947]
MLLPDPRDNAVRNSTSSISYRALRKAFSMMSRVTGSTGTLSTGVLAVSTMVAIGAPDV